MTAAAVGCHLFTVITDNQVGGNGKPNILDAQCGLGEALPVSCPPEDVVITGMAAVEYARDHSWQVQLDRQYVRSSAEVESVARAEPDRVVVRYRRGTF